MSRLLEIEGLTKRFGPITAVDNISFSVDRGEVLGFLGPNGAGKSTTMKMITGYLSPTAGKIMVCGNDVRVHPIETKRRIGYLPEGAPLYGDMTPHSLLNFVCDIRQLSREQRRRGLDHGRRSLGLALTAVLSLGAAGALLLKTGRPSTGRPFLRARLRRWHWLHPAFLASRARLAALHIE